MRSSCPESRTGPPALSRRRAAADPDPVRHLPLLALHEDREMAMDVEEHLLARLALDPVDHLAEVKRARVGEHRHLWDRHVLEPERPRRGRSDEGAGGKEGSEKPHHHPAYKRRLALTL